MATVVVALADGALSEHEALVMYATAVVGAARSDVASLTGLTETDIEAAVAQLIRRGLIKHPAGPPHHPSERFSLPPAAA